MGWTGVDWDKLLGIGSDRVPISVVWKLLISFANCLGPDQAWWVQTVWHSDGIPDKKLKKKLILKN